MGDPTSFFAHFVADTHKNTHTQKHTHAKNGRARVFDVLRVVWALAKGGQLRGV
jgi:hypothetical protein